MDFSVKVEGLDRLKGKLGVTPKLIRQEVSKALFVSAKHVEGEAKRSILNGQKSGRLYKRGKTVFHRASAPGEAPASDTGRLANSINSYLDSTALGSFVVAGRGLAKYAPLLEFGTSKIAPRPFLFPALEQSKPFIQKRMNEAVDRAIAEAAKK
jgi:HK97 gp10 family phage protein